MSLNPTVYFVLRRAVDAISGEIAYLFLFQGSNQNCEYVLRRIFCRINDQLSSLQLLLCSSDLILSKRTMAIVFLVLSESVKAPLRIRTPTCKHQPAHEQTCFRYDGIALSVTTSTFRPMERGSSGKLYISCVQDLL